MARTRAESADRHELYELAVQEPPVEVEFTSSTFRQLRGRDAKLVREDFCGTAVFSLAWVRSDPERRAISVDLDRETLDWGLDKRIRPASEDYESRISLRCANVLDPSESQADLAVAFNFSYWCFDTREALRNYFETVRGNLVDDGVLFLDAYGGTEVPMADTNERLIEDDGDDFINGGEPFTYIWEQRDYNPVNARMACVIHFEFEDGSRIDEAFTYDWRIWNLREISELLHEAGFVRVRVWVEDEDDDDEGLGTFSEVTSLDNAGVWWAYISAEKVTTSDAAGDDTHRTTDMGGKQHRRKHKQRKQRGPTLAQQAELHRLYEGSVQSPEADCELFADIYERLRQREPKVLREDFCGTALLSTTWCLDDPSRRAIGVDLDAPTLAWGREHNLEPNAEALGGRVRLIEGNVLDVDTSAHEPADITAALNFSFCIFKQRATLKRYFEQALAALASDGMLFLELFGGSNAIDYDKEIRELDEHTYIWEQVSFNPITNEIECHIHFEFKDKSRLDKAFVYNWRLWSIPELRDLLEEVGFAEVRVYWEKVEEEDEDDDDDDEDAMLEGTGEYEEVTEVEQQESWLVYVVASK